MTRHRFASFGARNPLFIDTNAPPEEFSELTVKKNETYGGIQWDPSRVALLQHRDGQEKRRGSVMLRYFDHIRAFNVQTLFHLYRHQHIIPHTWKYYEPNKIRIIYCWGTIYAKKHTSEDMVGYMFWRESTGEWEWAMTRVHKTFHGEESFAAVFL